MPRIHVFQQYFNPPDRLRAAEIDYCIYKNSRQTHFNYYLLIARHGNLPPVLKPSKNTNLIDGYGKRLTYLDWIILIERLTSQCVIGINDWALLLNSDIFVDDTLAKLSHIEDSCWMPQNKFFLACTRHCFYGIETDPNPQMLQDAWGVQARQTILPKNQYYQAQIPLGIPGCDNRIASVFRSCGYLPLNLAYHIKFTHVHRSHNRSYNESDRIKGAYTFIHPIPSHISFESILCHYQLIDNLARDCDSFIA